MTKELIADSWKVVRAAFEEDDLDTVFRFRMQMPAKKVRSRYSTMMILRWPYTPKKDGMPREADMKRMSAFEDALEISVEAPQVGLQAACLTGNGRRTWRYYVADRSAFLAAVQPLLEANGAVPHLFKEVDDPEWEGLSDLLPLLECEDEED